MAAFTRSGARKASEIVMLTFRTLHRSRLAMLSAFAFASARSSSSQRRPRAIDATRSAQDSERIGRACCGGSPARIFLWPRNPVSRKRRPREAETRFECRLRRRKSEHQRRVNLLFENDRRILGDRAVHALIAIDR